MATLTQYMKLASRPDLLGVAISCDTSDTTMSRNLVHEEIHRILSKTAWHRIFVSPNTSKIEACNANMAEIPWEWDIVVLVSDDMIPHVQGYDDVIRNSMATRFPDTDGIVWLNDGAQGEALNTLTIFGRRMYDSFGYLYHPDYKSLFCDTELTDLCTGRLKEKCVYMSQCIIRHEHPGTGFPQRMDALYQHNQKFWSADMRTYIRRKSYPHHLSILIPTIPGREASLQSLLRSISEKIQRNAPDMTYKIDIAFDNCETSIGLKRQSLLKGATGRYTAFIDDDDDITDEYIQDTWACIQGGYDVMRLRGSIGPYTFTHSLEFPLTSPMAIGEVFVRPPNHLNPMLSDIGKLIPFKNAVRGEDLDWTVSLSKSGFLTREYRADASRIHYIYNLGDRPILRETLDAQRNMTYGSMLNMIFTPVEPPTPPPPKKLRLTLGPRGFVSK